MTFEQMKENLKTVKLLEKDLMRDLTDEEREIVIEKGWEEFLFKYLGFSNEDFVELKAIKAIISAFYTQDENTFEKAIKAAPEGAYFVLRDIVDEMEGMELCTCPAEDTQIKKEVTKKEPIEEYMQFMQDLYADVPKKETPWFNKLTEDLHKKLFNVYRTYRNENCNVEDAMLGGIMTDAVKDEVVKAMVDDLKAGKTVEMTNDEYLEVADYLCEHENHVFLHNENGNVRLINF